MLHYKTQPRFCKSRQTYKSMKDNKLSKFSFKVMHRIITTKKLNSKQTPSIGFIAKEIFIHLQNSATKPNLDEFLRDLFEQYPIENCGKQN